MTGFMSVCPRCGKSELLMCGSPPDVLCNECYWKKVAAETPTPHTKKPKETK